VITQAQIARLQTLALIGLQCKEQLEAATEEAATIMDDQDYAIDLVCNGHPLQEILQDLLDRN
jgi:hypothetical protein